MTEAALIWACHLPRVKAQDVGCQVKQIASVLEPVRCLAISETGVLLCRGAENITSRRVSIAA